MLSWIRRAGAALALLCATPAALAQQAPAPIHLWPNGAPGFERLRNAPERAQDWWVDHINNPSITPFLPTADAPTGTAVVIVPGGGHRQVVFPPEGIAPAQFFQHLGVAAFALKYRLANEEGSPYTVEDAANDVRRAMRYVRAHAAEWGVDPHRVGLMGWSAGGELAAMVTYGVTDGDARARDPIERQSCRPDFQIVIYPGERGVPDHLNTAPPPAFFLAANDDLGPASTIVRLLALYRAANAPVEAHLYAQGGHAFNMGDRSQLRSIHSWPDRLADWMADSGYLAKR